MAEFVRFVSKTDDCERVELLHAFIFVGKTSFFACYFKKKWYDIKYEGIVGAV